MRITSRQALFVLLLCGLGGSPSLAQPTNLKDKEPNSPPAIKLPSGAIIVVTSDPDSIDKSASVYLTPAQYKELSDQIEALKKQIAAEKPTAPSSCEIGGSIEQRGAQSIVCLQIEFHFRTSQPRSVIYLGCQKTQLVKAKLDDGKLPLLAAGDKGLSVLVEDAGEHVLRLDLETALMPRGPKSAEIGFEIGLPGAAITLLSFAAPPKVQRMTMSRREIGAAPPADGPLEVKRIDAERLVPGRGGEALGPIVYLALSWADETLAVGGTATRSVETDVQVTIGDRDIVVEARIRMKGAAREWRFSAPSNAEVTVGRAPATSGGKSSEFPSDLAPDIVRPEPGQSIWRIRFREVNSTELLAVIVAKTPRNRPDPKTKLLWPVGPFAVLDVPQQTGAIRVRAPQHIRVKPFPKGDYQKIDASDDPDSEIHFRYRSLPMSANNQPAAPLELDIQAAAGVVQTRIHHHLQMTDNGWRLRSEIAIVPIRMEVESLDIEVPSAVIFDAATPKLVESISPLRDAGLQRRIIQVRLAAAQRSEFTLALEGFYPMPTGAQEAAIVLPRMLGAFDRQGQVTAVPLDGFDLRGNVYQWEIDKPGKQPHPLEPATPLEKTNSLSASVSRTASQVYLAWKAQRSDVRVESQMDITLGDRQGLVSHTLKYRFADRLPKRFRVRATSAVTGLAVTPGSLEPNGSLDWFIIPPPGELGRETTFVLNYGFMLPVNSGEDQMGLSVPLLWPDGTTWCENRVLIWRDRQATRMLLPRVESEVWEERPSEVLANETSLPLLVLRGTGMNLPLNLRLTELGRDGDTMTTVWIDRVLIQAQSAGANQQYRARFHLSKWSARSFDVELPVGAMDVEASLDGVDPRDGRAGGERGRILRITLPAFTDQKQPIVEIRYQLPGGHREGFAGIITVWQPPRLLGRAATGAVRWQVASASNSVPLALGDFSFEERWAIRNGMAQPLAAYTTADLEKWIASGREPDGNQSVAGWEMTEPGITARHSGLTPLRVAAVPRPAFLVVVTLLVLIVGFLLARLPKRVVGVLLSVMAAGAIAVGILWPQPAGQFLSAAQPGLVLLGVILGIQRVLQWRYRRRLTRMPGFARVRTESALTRSNGRRVRETSTIDSPAAT